MVAFGDSCRHSQLKAIKRSCRSMAAALGVQEQGARRIPMQDWLRFPLYLLRRSHWELLRSGERQYNKIEGIAQHLVSCGLRSPSERTQTTMCALIVHTSPEEGAMRLEEDGVRAQALLSTVKAVLKAKILRAKTHGTPLVGNEYIVELPASVGELPATFRQQFFESIAAVEPPIDLNPVWRSANAWVCRSTNQRVRQEAFPRVCWAASNGAADSACRGQYDCILAAGQRLLQGCLVCRFLRLPKKRIQLDSAGSSQLQHLMNRFDDSDASASASTMPVPASGTARVEPRMLALEDRPAGPASSVPCKSAGADLEEKMPLMQAEAKEEGRVAPPPGGPLEQSLAALAHAHYQKELPERPGLTASGAENSSKAKGLKRPASVLRKPSACKSSLDSHPAVAKRPAAKQMGRKETAKATQDAKQNELAVKANRKKAGGIKKKASAVKASGENRKKARKRQVRCRPLAVRWQPRSIPKVALAVDTAQVAPQAAGNAAISN